MEQDKSSMTGSHTLIVVGVVGLNSFIILSGDDLAAEGVLTAPGFTPYSA
jgi:hypothetical protein